MSTVLDFVFGKKKEKSSSKPVDVTPPELEALRGPFAEALTKLFAAGDSDQLSGIPKFSGSLTAPIGQNEQDILALLRNKIGQNDALISDTLSGQFLPGQPGANPFIDAAIRAAQRPTLEGLTQTLTRDLPGRFTAAGQFVQPRGSSAFDTAAALATRGAANALGDIATNISAGAFESERGRQQEAIQLNQREVESTIENLRAQALPRIIEDLGVERGLAEFQNRIGLLLQALATATGAPLVTVGQQQSSKGSSQQGIFSQLFPQGLGNLAG